MSETNLIDAIAALLSTAEAHANALRLFGAVAGYDVLGAAANVEATAKQWAKRATDAAAEAARPKGPKVRLVIQGRFSSETREVTAELVRTTAKQALIKFGRSDEEAYKIETGYRVKRGSSFSDSWRIHPDDLPTVSTLKTGHNDVSKALAAQVAK